MMRMFAMIGALAMLGISTHALWVAPNRLQYFSRTKQSGKHITRHAHSRNFEGNSGESNIIGRRQLIRGMVLSSIFKNTAANAGTLSPAIKPAICDSTVESYCKGSHQIHIVGTAHISSVSSQLSGASVRETKVSCCGTSHLE